MRRMTQEGEQAEKTARFVIGTMTGTSIDGDLDAALVAIEGRGLTLRARFVAGHSHPLGSLTNDLRRVAAQEPLSAKDFARIAHAFGEVHAEALTALANATGIVPDLAVLHGQTVFHAPPLTWQLLNPWPVAVRLGCRVRYDLRSANVASGGQGAPITPLADFVLFATDTPAIVMNLGGFINATLVPARHMQIDAIRGFDVCACNHLLDRVAQSRLGVAFDEDGAVAATGSIDCVARDLISHAIAPPHDLAKQHALRGAPRRSLGTGDEAARLVMQTDHLAPADACHTVVDAIADAATRVLFEEFTDLHTAGTRLLLAGGSARNRALQAAFARRWTATVQTTTESHGIPVNMREAAEMAILGALADDGVSITLPQVTGAPSAALDSALIERRKISGKI